MTWNPTQHDDDAARSAESPEKAEPPEKDDDMRKADITNGERPDE